MKKIVAFLLAAVMVLSMLPMTAFARDTFDIRNQMPESEKETWHGYAVVQSSANLGETVTINVYPNEGYMVNPGEGIGHGVLYAYEDEDENTQYVPATKVNDSTYTFEMPAYDVSVQAYFAEKGTVKTPISEVNFTVGSFTRDNLKNPPSNLASIASYTEGGKELECKADNYVFLDKDRKPIYTYVPENGGWHDGMSQEAMQGEPDYSKIAYALLVIECAGAESLRVGDFAPEVTVTINGGEPLKQKPIEQFGEGYDLSDQMFLQVCKEFDLTGNAANAAKTATNVPAGDATSMTLWVVVLAISIMGVALCFPFIKKKVS